MLLKQLTESSREFHPELHLELAAAWTQAGFPTEAQQTIRELAQDVGYGTSLKIRGRLWVLPESEAAIAGWTNQLSPATVPATPGLWLSSQGNPAGHLAQPQQAPQLMAQWQRSMFQSMAHPEFTPLLDRLSQFAFSAFRDAPVGPAQPLVTDDLAIVQGVATIQALDRQTGQLIWESSRFNRQLKSALHTIAESPEESQRFVVAAQIIANAPQNHVRGQMACDGELLFCVEETSQGVGSPFMAAGSTEGNQNFNILRVYDVTTGRLRGQIGGLPALPNSNHVRALDSVYFLGAPLLLDDRILILAEDAQGIHLLDLRLTANSQSTAEELTFVVEDRQLLFVPKYELQSHPLRRFAGITPTFSSGRIICHGCDEHVLAVEASDLSLRWIHRYRGNVNPKELGNGDPVLGNAFSDADSRRRDRILRAHDSIARVAGNYIILMPRDSDQIICLDLQTGHELWSRPRNHLKFVAALTDQAVVLAGETGLISIRLADGKPIWQHVLDDASISGQPASTGRLIYLPTKQGLLITLSQATGRQLLRQKLRESRLGNLTSIDGQLLDQTELSISSWITATNVEPKSLVGIYEALLKEDIPSAIEGLTRLIDSTPPEDSQRLRQLLAEQLFESLRLDYAANQHMVGLLQTLIDEASMSVSQIAGLLHRSVGMTLMDAAELPTQWTQMQNPLAMRDRMEQLVIQGLMTQQDLPPDELITQVSGALRGALTQPEREQRSGRIRRLSANHAAAVINAVLQRLDPTTRDHVIESLRPLVQQIVDNTGDESLALHQAYFCWMAGLSSCLSQDQLFGRLPETNRNPFHRSLLASHSTGRQPAVADFGSLWQSGDVNELRRLLQSPEQEDGPLNDGVGRIADYQRIHHRTLKHLHPQVEIGEVRTARALPNPTIGSVRKLIPLYGTPGVFRGWQFVRLQGESGFLAIDSDGRRQWTFDYSARKIGRQRRGRLRPTQPAQQQTYCVALGQMLAVVEGGDLIMLDGVVGEQPTPQVVWIAELAAVLPNPTGHQSKARAWERTQIYDRQPDGLAPLGPITEFGVPLFRGHRLVVLNPWNGAVMWFEEGLPDDCRLAAQDDRLCLISAATGQIQVRNMRDGSVLHSGELPAWWEEANLNYDTSVRQIDLEKGLVVPWRIAVEGTRCLIFTLTPGKASLQSYDLAQPDSDGPKIAWQAQLAENSVYSNVAEGLVATLQNDDHLQVRQVYDGKVVVDRKVSPAESCERLYLRKSHNRLIVLTYCRSNYEEPFPAIGAVPVNGPIYAFDAGNGDPAWTASSEHQSLKILNPDNAPLPASAPLLTLVKRNFPQVPAGTGIRSYFSAQILAVDDGSVIYEEENVGRTLSYHAMRFEPDGKITVSFEKRSVVFDFGHEDPAP